MKRSTSRWSASVGRILISAGVTAGLFAGLAVRANATAPRTTAGPDVIAFTASTMPPVGTMIATDLSLSSAFPAGSTSMVLGQVATNLLVAGISPSGSVLIALDPQLAPQPKPAVTPTGLASLVSAVALSNIVVTSASGLALAIRTASGALVLATAPQPGVVGWQFTVLTSIAGSPAATGTPELATSPSGMLEVFATSAAGHVIEWANDGSFGHAWNAYDLSAITGLDPVVMQPQLAFATADGSVQGLLVETATHQLALLVDDNTTFTIWRRVSLALPAGAVPTGPPQMISTPMGLALSVTTLTGALIATAPSVLGPFSWVDLTASLVKAKQSVAANSGVAISPTLTLYLRSTAGDLLAVSSWAAASGPVVANMSGAVGVGERISSDPAFAMTPSGPALIASDGGSIPLVAKIVALARSLDQNHAGVVETPLNTNCNPYTGYFRRGSTSMCPKGMASEEWCSDFANWVWAKSGAQIAGITGYSYTFVTAGARLGTFKAGATNNPKPGDAVVWGYAATGVGNHVGLVVAVKGNLIDVVSGNAGPATPQGYNVKVWDSGFFDPATSHDAPSDGIVGYVTPLGIGQSARSARPSPTPVSAADAARIARQDGGR